jgi:hypothetical protein
MTNDIAFDQEQFVAGPATAAADDETPLRAQSLIGNSVAMVWVKNLNNQWYSPDKTEIADAQLTIAALSAGTWRAQWLNTYSNETVSEIDISAGSGPVSLPIPAFERDIALRLDKRA